MKSLPPHPKKGAPAKRRNVIIACVCLCALVLAIRFFGSGSGGGSSRAVTRAYAQADGPRMQATFVDFDSGAQLVYTGRDQKRRKSDSSARDLGPLTDEQRAVVVETVTQSRLGSLIASIHGQSQQPGVTVEVLQGLTMWDLRELAISARDRLITLSQSKGIPEAPGSMAYFAAQRLGGHMLDLIDEAALSQSTCWVDPTFKLPLDLNGKVFIASLLKDQEVAMPQWIYQLLRLIALVGPENVFVSLVESGSGKDDTPAFVQLTSMILEGLGVSHMAITSGQIRHYSQGRVEALSQLRNTAMLPLFPDSVPPSVSGSKFLTANGQTLRLADADAYSRVLWLNDIFWCAEDMARLLQHKADIVCGLDYTLAEGAPIFYDIWVSKDVDGNRFSNSHPYTAHPESYDRVVKGLPFAVLSCWNGALAAPAEPFKMGLLFTAGHGKEDCRSSESERIVTDMVAMGYQKVLIDPSVRNSYKFEVAKKLYTYPLGTKDLPPLQPWSAVVADPVVFPARVPTGGRVQCCELRPSHNLVDFRDCMSQPFSWSPINDALIRQSRNGA